MCFAPSMAVEASAQDQSAHAETQSLAPHAGHIRVCKSNVGKLTAAAVAAMADSRRGTVLDSWWPWKSAFNSGGELQFPEATHSAAPAQEARFHPHEKRVCSCNGGPQGFGTAACQRFHADPMQSVSSILAQSARHVALTSQESEVSTARPSLPNSRATRLCVSSAAETSSNACRLFQLRVLRGTKFV